MSQKSKTVQKRNTIQKGKTIKELLAEFEEIIAWFDGENLDVEQAIARFEEGTQLADAIKKQLEEAKNKIAVVNK
jgi:exodeoxyribonuclease VII small subunit